MARLRSAPVNQQAGPPPSQPTRQALKEKTNTTKTKAPIYEEDGNTEDLVKNARPKRGRAKQPAQNEDAFVMAGGLGQREVEEQPVQQSEPQTTDELAKSDAPAPPTARANRRPPRMTRKVLQSDAQSKVLDDMKKRMEATARQEASKKADHTISVRSETSVPSSDALPTRPPQARKSTNPAIEQSDFSISPSPPLPGRLSSVKNKRSSMAQPTSALKAQGTPAVETSILALKNFKRRPRQPSMLQMVQKATASARPSAAHIQAIEDPSVFDVDDVQDDQEEFAPEAEGTPLHISKAKQPPAKKGSKPNARTTTAPDPTERPKKRKSEDIDLSSGALEALRAKRQKSNGPEQDEDPLLALHQNGPAARTSSGRRSSPADITSNVQVINSSPSSTPPTKPSSTRDRGRLSLERDAVVPSTEREHHDLDYVQLNEGEDESGQDGPNGTMAEPASSSPLPSDPVGTQRTDIMADPLTQVSPQRPPPEKAKKKTRQKPMTTAALQSMLPKRRQPLKPRQRQSEYDVESDSDDDTALGTSHLEGDEDELGGSMRRQTKTAVPTSRKSTAPKSKPRQSKAASKARESSAPPTRKSTAPPTAKKGKKNNASKTYARGEASDKENEDDAYESLDENDESALPDTSISMVEAAQTKELEQAKRKFADIDDWDMEFESMSVEEGRSSSQQWR